MRCNRDDKADTQRTARAGKFVGKSAHRHDRGCGRDDDCGSTRRQPVALARLALQASTKRLFLFNGRCRCDSLYFSSTSLNGTFQKIQPVNLLARALLRSSGSVVRRATGFRLNLSLLMFRGQSRDGNRSACAR